MFESLASCFAFSLQRFAQFATGRIRRGGHDRQAAFPSTLHPFNLQRLYTSTDLKIRSQPRYCAVTCARS